MALVFVATAHVAHAVEADLTMRTALETAAPGDNLLIGYTPSAAGAYLNASPNQLPDVPGTLLYSDDPETALSRGVLYRDRVPAGPARVYSYHVNGISASGKLALVAQNAGASTATVTFTRRAVPTPSTNYGLVGREGVRLYYENASLPATLTLAPGAAVSLDPGMDTVTGGLNRLIHGIHDFSADQPLTVTVAMLDAATPAVSGALAGAMLAGDGSNRQSTAVSIGRTNAAAYGYDSASGVKRLRIADGAAANDPAVTGTDAETGAANTVPGNFGVAYRVRVNLSATDGRNVALVANPRGGAYAGYFRTSFAGGPARPVAPGGATVPASGVLADNTRTGVIGLFTPAATPSVLTIEFIPAGASSLPIELHLVPYGGGPVPAALSRFQAE